MPGIMVPVSTIEEFSKPRETSFPEGRWILKLEETRERAFPDFIAENVASGKNVGYTSGDGETLDLQFGGARSESGDEETNQKLFVSLVTRDGAVSIEAGPDIPERAWQMQNSAALLTTLAIASGATETVELDGKAFYEITDGFLDSLRRGEYNDVLEVGAEVYHRKWKKGEKSGTEVKVRSFFQAV